MPKGYKLAAPGDGLKTCAFYFSEKGCRSGATCKFSHDKPVAAKSSTTTSPPSVCSSSVVSSESESDGEIVENHAGAYASLARNEVDIRQNDGNANPFLTAVSAPPPSAPVVVAKPAITETQQQPPAEKKKKKKRKKSVTSVAAGENIFDLGKTEDQSPTKAHTLGTVAALLNSVAASVAAPPIKKAKQAVASPHNNQKQHPTINNNTAPPSFRNLQLPIASFSIPAAVAALAATPKNRPSSPQHDPAPLPPPLPLPTATAAHLKWKNTVTATRNHANYANAFNFERTQQAEFSSGISSPQDWITSRPYGQWCASNPAAIAIDCEMCETKDPASEKVDTKALCRISIVNAENPSEVLLDTLVKPQWPVSNHRTWINGISAADLDNVQFTLQHAQTFMQALCSEQTIIVGHAVHNDLMALRMVHNCNVDTAMLFTHTEENDGTPSLKNLAHCVLQREMPEVHDSVNDARSALECALHYVTKKGKVDPIEKVYSRSNSGRIKTDAADTTMLLVHRLPTTTLPNHITEMFLAHTCVKPKNVTEIVFSGVQGKCHVDFLSKEHAELAYMSLVGKELKDKGGKKQKRVGLKGGGYVCVRKMEKGK